MKKSNEELLKDIEELTEENTKLLGKVKLLVNEEGKLRDQLHSHSQADAEVKLQLMKSFEGKLTSKMTPEKDSHMESAFRHIDNSSINVCPTCEGLRDENRDLQRKLGHTKKESEMLNIRNEELLKQIRLLAVSNQEQEALRDQQTMASQAKQDYNNTRMTHDSEPAQLERSKQKNDSFTYNMKSQDQGEKKEIHTYTTPHSTFQTQPDPNPTTPFTPMKADLAETLRLLKESKNKMENFQLRMMKENDEKPNFSTPFTSGQKNLYSRVAFDEKEGTSSKGGQQQTPVNSESVGFLNGQAVRGLESSLPRKKDFSLPRTADISIKLNSFLTGSVADRAGQSARDDQPASIYSYFKANHSDGFAKDDPFSAIKPLDKPKEAYSSKPREMIAFKELENLDKLVKDDISKLRPRRDERLLTALDDRIRADRSVDFSNNTYNRYIAPAEDPSQGSFAKKQRKSIGHAPQSKYLERLSKLYEAGEDYPSMSMTHDHSFGSHRRQSSSQDRTQLTVNDTFLKQINDRISSLVTK